MQELEVRKRIIEPKEGFWYPYQTMLNFDLIDQLLRKNRNLLKLIGDEPIADIGAADGDIAFFLSSLGLDVRIIDHAPTNYNGLRGAQLLKENLGYPVEIYDMDLDSLQPLPDQHYGFVLFLGTLYHLKNPFYVLENLARHASYCLLSTRVAMFAPDRRTRLSDISVAYLLDERECNNDSTNYWIFSESGLQRILTRTGWRILEYTTIGNTINSDPTSQEGDERVFSMLESTFAKVL
jgi:hypothetical protein